MTYLNMTTTTRLPFIIKEALSYARNATGLDGFRNIGSTQGDVNALIVSIVNEAQREFFDRFTVLKEKTGTLSMVGNQRWSDIPVDLRDSDIIRFYYTDGEWAGRTIKMETIANLELMPPNAMTDQSRGYYDEFVAVFPPHDNTKVYWYPMPSDIRTIGVTYRSPEAKFVVEDIDDPVGTICDIPDRMIPTFAILVAVELSDRISGGDQSMNAMTLREKYERKAQEWESKLMSYQGQSTNETYEWGGYPKTQGELRSEFDNGWCY